jgi:hypothetical protein
MIGTYNAGIAFDQRKGVLLGKINVERFGRFLAKEDIVFIFIINDRDGNHSFRLSLFSGLHCPLLPFRKERPAYSFYEVERQEKEVYAEGNEK